MLNKYGFLSVVVFSLLVFAGLNSVAYASEIEWRFQNTWPEKRTESKVLDAFSKRVYEKSDGRLNIKMFHGGSLGINQADQLRIMKSGAVEATALYPGYLGRDAPEMAYALGNGVVFTEEEAIKLVPTLQKIYTEGYEKWDAIVVGWMFHPPWRLSIFCNEPINSLAQLKEKKLRVWVKDIIDTFNGLDIPAQLIPQAELYVAMQTGVVDCAVYSVAIAKTISLQEVSSYASALFSLSGLSAITISKKHWEELPTDLQSVVKEAGEWTLKQSLKNAVGIAANMEKEVTQELANSGELVVLEPFSKEDRKTFYDEAVKTWVRRTNDLGGQAPVYRDQIMEALKKIRGN